MNGGFDRLSLLATFVRIVERGSISGAARDLGVSQASASRQLSALEQQMGAHLINRTTHGLSLTEAGSLCLADARGLLDGWDGILERVGGHESNGALRGPLKIVAPIALGQLHLAAAALDFQKDYPDVALTWLLLDETIRFAEIGCDLWIRVGPVPDDTLIVRELASVERLVVAAPGFAKRHGPVDPLDLTGMPCAALTLYEGAQLVLSRADGETRGLDAQVKFSTNNIFAVREAVLAGAGYAILPRWMVGAELNRGALVDLLPGWRGERLTVNGAYQPAQRQTLRLSVFVEHIAEALAGIPGVAVPDKT